MADDQTGDSPEELLESAFAGGVTIAEVTVSIVKNTKGGQRSYVLPDEHLAPWEVVGILTAGLSRAKRDLFDYIADEEYDEDCEEEEGDEE